ncbi:MAG: N-acetyltransferase [Firmicutes bacterium]|nr:N-acetyltransferase [Bacillota bacterium]
MEIRKANLNDVDEIMRIYAAAKAYMVQTGNKSQWINGYPQRELVESDIERGICHVCEDEDGIHGVFAFILGADPTYSYIEDGEWKNDRPYGTVHRIGSDGKKRGIFNTALDYCKTVIPDLRIDTHADNKVMQNLITAYGFDRCGIIYIDDGSPRIAYQYEAK